MGLPMVRPETTANPAADLAFLTEALKAKENSEKIVKGLATHIQNVFLTNMHDCKPKRLEMLTALRRVNGVYSAEKIAAIKSFKGSEAYIRSIETKARAAESWIKDIYRGDTDLPWQLEPTSEPDLPDETQASVIALTKQMSDQMLQEVVDSGADVSKEHLAKLTQDYYEAQLDKERDKMKKTADDRCKRAASHIRDQNQESGWSDAFKNFVYYFVRLKVGVIKGPILTKKPKTAWVITDVGAELQTNDVLVDDVYAVSPFNFFPSKGMKTINDGDLIEIHELSKQAITGLIDVPGYSSDEIKMLLSELSSGSLKAKWLLIDDESEIKKTVAAVKEVVSATEAKDSITAMEFSGTVEGKLLIEWGMQGAIQPYLQYQVNCWKIGDHVIKAVVNPDPLGRKPYHVSSWAKNPESIWGEGMVEFAGPVEDAMNALVRAIINNAAIASGPMCEIDKDRVDNKLPLFPWRQIESTSTQMKNEGPAVNYYQPQMHLQELISGWMFFAKILDEMTVPAYAQGASQAGVTAGTATVFTQLLAAASRSIRAVVANIDDDITVPYTQMCYDNLMKFTDDESLKGDARTVAKGVAGLLAKEQHSQRKVELLTAVSNPAYVQILGAKNIGALLSQIIKGQDIKLPDLDRLDGTDSAVQELQQILMAQAGVQQTNPDQVNGQVTAGGGAPPTPGATNPDGSQAGVALQ